MPQLSQNVNPFRSTAIQGVKVYADFTGAGAAAPTVSASTELSARDNFASTRDGNTTTVARSGVGDHTYVFPNAPPSKAKVLSITAHVRGLASIDTTIPFYDVVNGRLQVNVRTQTPAGVLTDLTTSEFLRIAIEVDLSNS